MGEGRKETGRRNGWQKRSGGRGSEKGTESGTKKGLKWEGEEMPQRGRSD